MFATAPSGTSRPAHEETVRLRPGDLPVRLLPKTTTPIEEKTTRLRSADLLTNALPKAISGFDGKTVRMRGEEMMFDLNPATFTITLVGHLIFGLFLGLAFLKAPRGKDNSGWQWPPLSESAPAKRVIRIAKKVTHSP